ncbi:MAG: cell division topological specificity factor MinE [Clostridia bacterium]|nr:cell division topological specificity factor MinE [Clostridia bacterium]
MFENIANFFKKLVKSETKDAPSKNTAKERLHLVLMQDRANVSADFLELMKQEIIEVIKKYIEVEESAIDVRLTNDVGEDGTKGAPSLYANIPIVNIKNGIKNENVDSKNKDKKEEVKQSKEDKKEEKQEIVKENEDDKKKENKEDIKENKTGEINKVEENTTEPIELEEKKETKEDEKTEQKVESIDEPKKEENKTE